MNELLYGIILSILPISELRLGIPVAMASNLPLSLIFLSCVIANILIIPIIFLFLDYLHIRFLKIKVYEKLFSKLITRTRNKIEHRVGTKWEMPALFLLVAIPLPGTGAYTGVLAAWLFKLRRKQAFIAISLGVLFAGIIITIASLGIYSII
jgi:uncharacterized membrane protein